MNINSFLYLAIGSQKYKLEAYYSINSLLKTNLKNSDIVLITDEPERFSKITFKNFEIIKIDEKTIKNWTNNDEYVFYIKIHAIKLFYEKYNYEKVLFVDTDTIIFENIEYYFDEISENNFILGYHNTPMVESLKVCRSLDEKSKEIISIEKIYNYILGKGMNFVPYNSGIIGMHYKNTYLFKEILSITKDFYFNSKHFGSEEIAFSYVFQKYGTIIEKNDGFYHYTQFDEARLVCGYLLNILTLEDKLYLDDWLDQLNIKNIDIFDLKINEVEYFILFAFYFFNKPKHSLESNGIFAFIEEIEMKKKFEVANIYYRKFFKKTLLYNKNLDKDTLNASL